MMLLPQNLDSIMTPRSKTAGLMVDTGNADHIGDNSGNTVTFPLRTGNTVMLRMSPRDTMVKIHAPAADYPPWSGVKRENTPPSSGMCVYPPANSMRSPPIAPSAELDSSFYSMVGPILKTSLSPIALHAVEEDCSWGRTTAPPTACC